MQGTEYGIRSSASDIQESTKQSTVRRQKYTTAKITAGTTSIQNSTIPSTSEVDSKQTKPIYINQPFLPPNFIIPKRKEVKSEISNKETTGMDSSNVQSKVQNSILTSETASSTIPETIQNNSESSFRKNPYFIRDLNEITANTQGSERENAIELLIAQYEAMQTHDKIKNEKPRSEISIEALLEKSLKMCQSNKESKEEKKESGSTTTNEGTKKSITSEVASSGSIDTSTIQNNIQSTEQSRVTTIQSKETSISSDSSEPSILTGSSEANTKESSDMSIESSQCSNKSTVKDTQETVSIENEKNEISIENLLAKSLKISQSNKESKEKSTQKSSDKNTSKEKSMQEIVPIVKENIKESNEKDTQNSVNRK